MKGWFLLDLVSSVPLEHIVNSLDMLQSAKILKFGKVFKVFKMLRIAKGGSIARKIMQLDDIEVRARTRNSREVRSRAHVRARTRCSARRRSGPSNLRA